VRRVACGAQEFTTEDAKGDDTGLGKVANVKVTTSSAERRATMQRTQRTPYEALRDEGPLQATLAG